MRHSNKFSKIPQIDNALNVELLHISGQVYQMEFFYVYNVQEFIEVLE
jgi:hypothetical protein